jgi:Tol biopolymer transport system component
MLSHYRLIEKIGEGGMGVVWKAVDTTLDREVAIKILPDAFSQDPERLARFEREAKLLASLNHTNIATVHSVHETDGVRFLVLEYVAGEDLAQRLARGAIPVEEALPIAVQIADALEAAHEHGVIHRDLKPANIKITPEGNVKVLDFGLAKALAEEAAEVSGDPSHSPTMTAATQAGVILGTAAYMSPEQARGKRVDKRTDIWAFGCVFFELLTGRQVFSGETASDSIAGILEREPDWTALPQKTPHTVRVLLRRCLEKNPLDRLRDIGDARIVLAELQTGRAEEPASQDAVDARTAAGWRWNWLLSGLVLGFAAAGLAGWMLRPPGEEPQLPVRRYRLAVPALSEDWKHRPLISSDGRRVVYVADDHLWIHELDELEPRRLEGTEDATAPFWSPDGESLAFGREGKLWRIEVDRGTPRLLCDVPGAAVLYDGDWNKSDVIVFAANRTPIYEVSAQGGEPRVRVALDTEREVDFHSVRFLPDGETLLAQPHMIEKGFGIESEALLILRADGTRNVVLSDESWSSILHGRFASDHIIYERRHGQKGVWAAPFSLATLETTGDAFPIALRGKRPSAASDGTLLYVQDDPPTKIQPALVDRAGNVIKAFGEPQMMLRAFSISPDGRRAVFTVGEAAAGEGDLWLYDLERDTTSPLTRAPGLESMPHWSPDGSRIAFVRGVRPGEFELAMMDVDDPGRSEDLGSGFRPVFSSDGRFLTHSTFTPPNDYELWYRSVGREGESREFPATEGREVDGRVSPDGRYIAYAGRGTQGQEVFIRSFPDGEARQQVSTEGGMTPRWSPRGDELFYVNGEDVMAVSVSGGANLDLGETHRLFTRQQASSGFPDGWSTNWLSNLEVTPDGESFLILRPSSTTDEDRPDQIVVVQNWLAGSSRR